MTIRELLGTESGLCSDSLTVLLSFYTQTLDKVPLLPKYGIGSKDPVEGLSKAAKKFFCDSISVVCKVSVSNALKTNREPVDALVYALKAGLVDLNELDQDSEDINFNLAELLPVSEMFGDIDLVHRFREVLTDKVINGVVSRFIDNEVAILCRCYARQKVRTVEKTRIITKEVPVIQKEMIYDDEMFGELVRTRERVQILENKVSALSSALTSEETEIAEEIYSTEVDDFDISNYKLLIIGSKDNSDVYPCDYLDFDSCTDRLGRIAYVDYVLFDTRVNGHKHYYAVKSVCKQYGVPLLHINCRNKDRILQEIKSAIAHKEGKF